MFTILRQNKRGSVGRKSFLGIMIHFNSLALFSFLNQILPAKGTKQNETVKITLKKT